MNNRIRFTIILSSADLDYQAAKAFLAPELCRRFAGASFQPIDGVWAKDGAEFKANYADGEQEPGIKIMLSVMPEASDRVVAEIRPILQQLKQSQGLALHWIHVEQQLVTAHHFQL